MSPNEKLDAIYSALFPEQKPVAKVDRKLQKAIEQKRLGDQIMRDLINRNIRKQSK